MTKLHLAEEELKQQQAIADKVKRVLTLVTAFEESSAECMSNILIHFSNAEFQRGILQSAKFVCHIETLFQSVDDIESRLKTFADSLGLDLHREPKQLIRRIVHFFSLLSKSQSTEGHQESTQDLITLVTYLARLLKTLMRYALTGALKLVLLISSRLFRL